jgi:hypothetical protein
LRRWPTRYDCKDATSSSPQQTSATYRCSFRPLPGTRSWLSDRDDVGGFIRLDEIAEIVRVCAPVYLKFGLRNAPNIYPSGTHLEATAVALTRERVRRAKIGLDLLARLGPGAAMSPLPMGSGMLVGATGGA